MTHRYQTPYRTINAKPRELCKCKRGPVREETGLCESCEQNAQADVVNLDEERDVRTAEKMYEGQIDG